MTGSAADKAREAADALLSWLSGQATRSALSSAAVESGRSGGEAEHAVAQTGSDAAAVGVPGGIGPSTDRTASAADGMAQAIRLPTPDWLHHRLAINGAAASIERFRQAAAGAGVIPWHLDLDRLEEGYFHLLVTPEQRSVSVAGARIFARQLRDAVGRRHDLAVARVGQSRACPFDLHALVPVPQQVLVLGPDDPRALAWLWEHWGTTEPLRHVAEHAGTPNVCSPGETAEATCCLSFWSADWTPWRALNEVGSQWPALHFEMRPSYDPP